MYSDPDGEFFWFAVLIGALIGGVSAAVNGGNFGDIVKGAFLGAFSGAVTFGIGSAFAGTTGILAGIAQAGVHGLFQGIMSAAQGGDFWKGFAAGAFGSGFAHIGQGLGLAGQTALGAIGGGIGAAITGGNIWEGAVIGGMVGLLNHGLHNVEEKRGFFNNKSKGNSLTRDGLKSATQRLLKWLRKKSKQIGNWWDNTKTAANMTRLWLTGEGAEIGTATFENDRVANALRNSAGMDKARNLYYNEGKTFDRYDFGIIKGPFHAGLDPIEQFVGSYQWKARVVGDQLEFTITNTTSLFSASYHRWPYKKNPKKGPMGDFKQVYIFREPLRK